MNEVSLRESATPVVTVIIPTFNRASIVGRAIRSVLCQTFQDWELLVVDDASTDGTEQVVRSFPDRRIRYLRHDQNRRVSAARNTGIRSAQGEYVSFLDDDDEWLPEKLAKEVEAFRNSDPEVGLIYTGKTVYDEHGRVLQVRMPTQSGWVYDAMLDRHFIGSPSRVTVRKQVLDRVAGFDQTFVNCQDYDLWLRVAKVSKIACVPCRLVKRYLLSDQMSGSLEYICEGWEHILMKFRADMKPRTLTKHISRVAILLFNYEPRRARALAREGLRLRPLQPALLAALALSTLGVERYRWVFGKMVRRFDRFYLGRARI
ncbi:MAG: glycosyltransferase [Terriglobia bacterium]|jgi:glycosyltransferase involved in cell wall biosynthesis